jgi:tRNA(fMet)-specific endonuclease VapC
VILDTNAVSDLFEGNASLARRLERSQRHQLPAIVLGEFRYGLMRSSKRTLLERLLARLERESDILSPDAETAVHYARIRNQLRDDGRPMPENDVWIAALAAQFQLKILSKDKHFDNVRGVTRVGW